MSDRYYYDDMGVRRSYFRDRLQMQREQVKQQARDKRLDRQTKTPFNQSGTKELTTSSTNQKNNKPTEDPVKISKTDELRSFISALNARLDSFESKIGILDTKVSVLQNRLDAATIDADCSASGIVTVTLNI